MNRSGHTGPMLTVASLILVSWHGISTAVVFAIGEGAQANEYARWCAQQGGTITNQGGLGCIPGSSAGGSFGGGGYSSREQAALGLAGAFGSALGNAIRESMEANARQAEMNRMQRAWEMDQERIRLEELRRREQEERERRHQVLMSNLKNSLGRTDLGFKRMETQELKLKSGSDLFSRPSHPSSILQDVPVSADAPDLAEPKTVEGRAVDPGLAQRTEKAWDGYLAAVERKNRAEARLKQVEAEQRMIEQLRREAEKKLQEQRMHVATIPPSRPEEKKIEDDKLAQAEKLLNEAIKLDEDATKDLADAKRNAEEAKTALKEAEKQKQQAMKAEKE
ncbi:MAG: hypothetical protein HZB34_08890 [Nitrospirae bacterium]|nr:hypothetical protein [Nitrospirota bacterium]